MKLNELKFHSQKPKTFVFIDQDAKTDDLFRKIKEKSGIPVDELRLLYGPKQLEAGKYLSEYHVENNSTLYLVLRLKGGMMDGNEKQLDRDVELTYEPDMITWDDDPDNLRAKMPCGHAIGKACQYLGPVYLEASYPARRVSRSGRETRLHINLPFFRQ